ncbi:MAG: clostripain-related cysteine peptidase, partial [Thermoplasmatota archaeon]
MKGAVNLILSMVIMTSVLIPLFDLGSGDTRSSEETSAASWLVLLYMAGDNNLGRDGYEWGNAVKMDVEEMESSMPDQGVEILALADMEGPSNTYLYDLSHDEVPGINSTTIPLSDVNEAWGDELDMSDWKTMKDFIVYSMSNRQAENVMFVLWNHGAGWYSSSQATLGT